MLNLPAAVSSSPSVEIGIDLVEVGRARRAFEGRRSFQEAVFTSGELSYSLARRNPYIYLAARFAVKEALFKALGTGLTGSMDWRDIEVGSERTGQFFINLSGKTAKAAEETKVAGYAVSLTQTRSYSLALVLLSFHSLKSVPS